jgi:hypothetical protein
VAVALGLLILCMVGSFMTRGVMEHLPFLHGQKAGWGGTVVPRGIVDQRPWQYEAPARAGSPPDRAKGKTGRFWHGTA